MAISVAAAAKRTKNEHQRAIFTAWNTAALGRVKNMPALDSLLGGARRAPARVQSWQEQLAMTTAWVATT